MVIYRKWVNFVIYDDAYLVHTPEQRVDTSNAIDWDRDKNQLPKDMSSIIMMKEKGLIVKQKTAVKDYDEFEAMEINYKGDVTIWTKRKIGYLIRVKSERMVYLDRHPPPSDDNGALSPVSENDDPLIDLFFNFDY